MHRLLYEQALALGLIAENNPEEDLEVLGEALFANMAFEYMGYNPFLSEVSFVDCIQESTTEASVTLSVNEISKQPHKVKFKILIEGAT